MKKVCVYTCITGSYDDVKEFKQFKEKNIDYILFTNNKELKSDFWKVVYIENDGLDNIRLNRKIKILGHELINNNYDYSVYIDGSISLRTPITEFIKNCCDFEKYDLIGFRHSMRDCIYVEGKACLKYMKEEKNQIIKEMDYIKSKNYPEHNGLMENTIFAKNLKSEKVQETCKLWFDMVMDYSCRDQLSFCFCAYQTKLKYKLLDMNVFDNEYFINVPHIRINQLDNFRFYFGDDTNIENMNYDYDIVGKYKKKNNHFVANVKSPCDTNLLKFVFGKFGMIKVNNIKLNDEIIDFDIIRGVSFDNDVYYCSEYPSIIIRKKIKKNDKVNISFDMELISQERKDDFLFDLVSELYSTSIERNALTIENENLKNKIDQIINSTSWKITKPIRDIMDFIRGKKKK